MKNRKEARNQSTLFHLSNYTKIVFGKKKKPVLVSCRASIQTNKSFIATRRKRKKNQVAVNFLVYRFPVNKYFNVPLTRGLTDPVYFSHPLFFNYNFITDSFAEIFYNFSLLFFFIEISIENLSIYSFVLILKVRLEATFIRVFKISGFLVQYFDNFKKWLSKIFVPNQ